MENKKTKRPFSYWAVRTFKILLLLFLYVDALMKVIRHPKYVEGTIQLGLPDNSVQPLGIYLLLATVLYTIPQTALLGAIFLSAYLGGAAAITYAGAISGHPYIFPIVFTALIWLAEYMRNQKIRSVLPITY